MEGTPCCWFYDVIRVFVWWGGKSFRFFEDFEKVKK